MRFTPRLRGIAAGLVLLAVSGCAATLQPGTAPTPATAPSATAAQNFNAAVALAIQGVTVARQTIIDLLNADKITVATEKAIRAKLDQVHDSLEASRALFATNPALAQKYLDDANASIAAAKKGIVQ